MIQLICTHCRAMLEMDDGFAGGACRCQHCGTIQTVPSHLKNKTSGAKKVRTLYQNGPAIPTSELDELAVVVVSSGLNSSRLRKPAAGAPDQKQQKNLKVILISAATILSILSATLIYLVTLDHSPAPAAPTNTVAKPAAAAAPNAMS